MEKERKKAELGEILDRYQAPAPKFTDIQEVPEMGMPEEVPKRSGVSKSKVLQDIHHELQQQLSGELGKMRKSVDFQRNNMND